MVKKNYNDLLEFLWICFLDFQFFCWFLHDEICYGHSQRRDKKLWKRLQLNVNAKKGEDIWEICSNSVPMLAKIRFCCCCCLLCIYISLISLHCSLSEPFIPFGHHTFFWCIKKNIFWIPSKELKTLYRYCVAGIMKQNVRAHY